MGETGGRGMTEIQQAEVECLRKVARAADAVIETGRRLRSDPGSHELALAALCAALGALAELPFEKGVA